MNELPVGILYGDYRCTHHLLHATSEGAVYKAHHIDQPDSEYAVRALQFPAQKVTQDVIDTCNEHMALVKSVSAPHIVPIIEYNNNEHEYYFIMPFLEGSPLTSHLKQLQDIPSQLPSFGEIVTFARAMVQALNGIHEVGLTHGAFEPRNIFIDDAGTPHLTDFGVSRLMKIAFSLQSTGSFWTGEYSAPEVWDGERNTPASDQYSLGCVLYQLVTGRLPFSGNTIFEMMDMHQNAIVQPPHFIRKDAPASLLMFFLTATAKRPAERYRSLDEMLNEFEMMVQNQEGEPTGFFTSHQAQV